MEKKQFQMELKNTLKGYRVINSRILKKFESMGFIILRCKNHYMLQYSINNKKYEFAVSKTVSKSRAGSELAGIIFRTLRTELV